MPTKRQFDMVVLIVLLVQPVKGLFKMVATRRAADDNGLSSVIGGAARIAS